MLLWVWVRDDATGLLDDEFRDGDVMQAKPDGSPVGTQERKSWLVTQIADPPDLERMQGELVRSEYAPGPTLGDDPVVRRKRIYTLDWRAKCTEAEIAILRDATKMLPDGPDVKDGIVQHRWTWRDLSRK